MMDRSVWIGFDPREVSAFVVAQSSLRKRSATYVGPVRPVVLDYLRRTGLYRRPTEIRTIDGRRQLWDTISDAPMSTEFAISRFLVPRLAGKGLALFTDSDVLFRTNVSWLFDEIDPQFAVSVVKHDHRPAEGVKMDGQVQTAYSRKNWSSVMVFNCDHAANKALTVDLVNRFPGRDLHRFCWLDDSQIGELPPIYNHLVGHTPIGSIEPRIVHFTDGVPDMPGYENVPFAEEWRDQLFDTLDDRGIIA